MRVLERQLIALPFQVASAADVEDRRDDDPAAVLMGYRQANLDRHERAVLAKAVQPAAGRLRAIRRVLPEELMLGAVRRSIDVGDQRVDGSADEIGRAVAEQGLDFLIGEQDCAVLGADKNAVRRGVCRQLKDGGVELRHGRHPNADRNSDRW